MATKEEDFLFERRFKPLIYNGNVAIICNVHHRCHFCWVINVKFNLQPR